MVVSNRGFDVYSNTCRWTWKNLNRCQPPGRLFLRDHLGFPLAIMEEKQFYCPNRTGRPKLITVTQLHTPDQVPLPQSLEEVNNITQTAFSAGCLPSEAVRFDGLDATVDRVSHALESTSTVHFACRGLQHPVLRIKSALVLHDGHLELGKIASKEISAGRLAFLSVCISASGPQGLAGKSIHLGARMQFPGFPSVIATMRSIYDKRAPKVAEHSCKHLFYRRLNEFRPSDNTAALKLAILNLREDSNITIDRWATFVHFGVRLS